MVAPRSALTSGEEVPSAERAAAGRASAARWGLALLPFLGLLVYGVSIALMPPGLFHWVFNSESGPVEIGTAGCFLAASVVAFRLAVRTRGRAPAVVRVLYLVFALGALFACLEEISYGQHFIGWHSPQWFDERNAQHETNLHNLFRDKPGKLLRNGALFAVALGGLVLPAAAALVGGQYAPGRWAYYLLPRAELVTLVVAAWIMRLARTLPRDVRSGRDTALFELLELYLAITALVFVLTLWRRLESGPKAALAERER